MKASPEPTPETPEPDNWVFRKIDRLAERIEHGAERATPHVARMVGGSSLLFAGLALLTVPDVIRPLEGGGHSFDPADVVTLVGAVAATVGARKAARYIRSLSAVESEELSGVEQVMPEPVSVEAAVVPLPEPELPPETPLAETEMAA
ncbi:MAG TPA: hypothetical protein VHA37_06170 [Candidatus Saccharimonadales bacterium]|nr:hypothetical protein [Candidatus Saccharimonadales bacterium]